MHNLAFGPAHRLLVLAGGAVLAAGAADVLRGGLTAGLALIGLGLLGIALGLVT